ncbi:MAG: InlB B-repeat-containing protein, partial [Clostridia bacterium]|nr:InlB B-repeat-containing protein [Clostridia bacterium]
EKTEYTVTFVSDGKTISEKKLKEGEAITKPDDPSKEGYTFKSWTPEVPDTMPANDLTFTAVFEENPDEKIPEVSIKGYTKSLPVDYKAKLTFNANVKNADGYKVVWSVNGNKTEGNSLTIEQAKEKEYKISVSLVKDGKTVKTSAEETVTVNTGFFAKIIAFFRSLFRALPVYVDNKKVK